MLESWYVWNQDLACGCGQQGIPNASFWLLALLAWLAQDRGTR